MSGKTYPPQGVGYYVLCRGLLHAALRKPLKYGQKIFVKIRPRPKFDEEAESGVILRLTVVKNGQTKWFILKTKILMIAKIPGFLNKLIFLTIFCIL